MKKIFFDTEFTNLFAHAELISAGFVAETGETLYLEVTDFNRSQCSTFVNTVVIPLLNAPALNRLTLKEFHDRLIIWLLSFNEDIELISDHMVDWYFVNSHILRSGANNAGIKISLKLFQKPSHPKLDEEVLKLEEKYWQTNAGRQHHALIDAMLLKEKHQFMLGWYF